MSAPRVYVGTVKNAGHRIISKLPAYLRVRNSRNSNTSEISAGVNVLDERRYQAGMFNADQVGNTARVDVRWIDITN